VQLLYTINHISEKWNSDTKGIIHLIEDSLGNLKSATEQNISQTAHGLDKYMINGFYGNTYETLPRENGFIYLKPVRILSDFISYLSDSNVILKGVMR
jgi:hypothetical protein